MVIGWARIGIRMPGVRSLKEKRHALRGVLEKLGREPMIAVAEVGDHDLWANAEIGISALGNQTTHIESLIQRVLDGIDEHPAWEVVSVERGIERVV